VIESTTTTRRKDAKLNNIDRIIRRLRKRERRARAKVFDARRAGVLCNTTKSY